MRFAEFSAGQVFELGPYVLDETALLDFARQWDPQWFHVDPERAAGGRFGGLIASGWQSCGIAMRLVADGLLAGSESFASPGLDELRWPAPVRPGDALRLHVEVLESRVSRSRPELGVLRWTWRLRNQHDVEVLSLTATSLFDLG